MLGAFLSGRVSSRPRPSPRSLSSSSQCPRPSRNWRPRRRDRGGGRRDVGKIERAEPTDAGKEKRDGTYGSTSRKPEADAADLPDDGAHGAAPLVRPAQDGNETGLWPPGRAGRSRGTCPCPV